MLTNWSILLIVDQYPRLRDGYNCHAYMIILRTWTAQLRAYWCRTKLTTYLVSVLGGDICRLYLSGASVNKVFGWVGCPPVVNYKWCTWRQGHWPGCHRPPSRIDGQRWLWHKCQRHGSLAIQLWISDDTSSFYLPPDWLAVEKS